MSETGDQRSRNGNGDHLAAEYVLGVLDAAERHAAQRRLAHDAAFAREVTLWEERLTPLTDSMASVEPPVRVWQGIASRLPGAATVRVGGVWESLAFWRGLAFGSLGLAAASLVAAAVLVVGRPPQPPMMAALAPEGQGSPAFIAGLDPRRATIMVMPAAFARAPERVAELWLIPPGGAPQSLGLLDPARPVTLTIPDRLLPHATPDATLAVSLEPPGGSPTGSPTGPVIAHGKLAAL